MISWFTRNSIAANLLMLAILLGGLYCAFFQLTLELEPNRSYGVVFISKSYPGATPKDVQKDILIPIENALESLNGVKQLNTDAHPQQARIYVEAAKGHDLRVLKDDIESLLKTITTIPAPNEPFRVSIPSRSDRRSVIWVVVTGELPEADLQEVAKRVRDDLLNIDGISRVNAFLPTERQLSVELNSSKLAAYDLSFQDVASAIRQFSIDLPAGSIKSTSGNLVVRTRGQAYTTDDFAKIPLRSSSGAELTLAEVAEIADQFDEEKVASEFNRRPAIRIDVSRTGKESALEVADKVRHYVATSDQRFPEGIHLGIHNDQAVSLQGRLTTLSSSLLQGAVLVIMVLGLFLRPQLAFWVVVGIPVSFAGGIMLMHLFGISANMMSLFGFIIVVGVVVDDAIVTGENVYSRMQEGLVPVDAAIQGTKQVTVPVTFGILTTIVAFLPLLFFEGLTGDFSRQIPLVVAPVLLFSLIESKLILPAHLKHLKVGGVSKSSLGRLQAGVARGLEVFVYRAYFPSLKLALRHRFAAIAVFVSMALLMMGYFAGGRLGYVSIPSVERPELVATLDMPDHVPIEVTRKYMDKLTDAAEAMKREFIDKGSGEPIVGNHWRLIGTIYPGRPYSPSNGVLFLGLMPPGARSEPGPNNDTIINRWRELVGELPGNTTLKIRTLRTEGDDGDKGTDPIDLELRGPASENKTELANKIADLLRSYDGIATAWAHNRSQQNELELTLKPRAAELGVTQQTLALQVRQAFYGEEAQRVLRGHDEYRIMVRLPKVQRESLHTLEQLKIRTSTGAEVPLFTVANVAFLKSPTFIERNDKAEVIRIGAEPVDKNVDLLAVSDAVRPRIEALLRDHEDLSFKFTGFVAEAEESKKRFMVGALALMFALYALLAIPFQSATQPFYILIAVPFGVIGAMLGHIILGITPSDLSLFGILAMAGVVVNDSLVMVDDINNRIRRGTPLSKAVEESGCRRFRPIFLTSATTFVGLVPLIFDNSLQAQFLIPMAVSLAFGVLFATGITLYLIPCLLMVADDCGKLLKGFIDWFTLPYRKSSR